MALEKDQIVGQFKILGSLGAGAMGEVYRARDSRLDREVALKVLPDRWLEDTQRQSRFEQEARTLASLNHQNIAQIYGIETVDARSVLAMELVPGETLEERIARRPLRLDDTIQIARQIACGLQAAHDAGLIHRDLKPGNVQITPQGDAKILDFGLAKSISRDNSPGTTLTEAGAIFGTPSYMSPEQVRGRPIDRRADIWAYGCILFEALTGDRPYAGESVPDILAAIVDREPDLSKLPSSTPDELRQLIGRCLDKDARTRLQDVGEARVLLEKGLGERPRRSGERARVLPVLFAATLGAGLGFICAGGWRDADVPANPLDRVHRVTELTSFEDSTLYDAAISPDGKYFAFISNHAGRFDAYAGPIGGGVLTNLTRGSDPFYENSIREIGFDASSLRVWLGGGGVKRVRTVSIQGDGLKPLLDEFAVEVDWTPDGSLLAFHSKRSGDPIILANGDGTDQRIRITHQPGKHQHFPTFSQDGAWLYLVRGVPATDDMQLFRLRPRGNEPPEQLTIGLRGVTHPTPIDEHHVLFLARDSQGAGPWLWSMNVEARKTRRLSVGLERFTSLAATDDGLRLVATVAQPSVSLWSIAVPGPESILLDEDARPFPTDARVRALTPRFAGTDLYFLSSRGGGDGLWCLREGKAEEILPGEVHSLMGPPAISPDGKSIAVVLNDGDRRRIQILSSDGAERTWLTNAIDVRSTPCWSRDGRSVIATGLDPTNRNGLFRIPLVGDGFETIVRNQQAFDPVHSPTEDLIIYFGEQIATSFPLRAVRSDGSPVELANIDSQRGGERARFLPDGSGIVYMQSQGYSQNFWLLDLASKTSRQLTSFKNAATMRTFDISPDGKTLVFDRLQQNSRVLLIELEPVTAR